LVAPAQLLSDHLQWHRFVQDPFDPEIIRAVTPPTFHVQHAKWSPDGRKIVFAYSQDGMTWGIAYIDLF
jgi:hypothetical protein